jgi:hypothetical protein
MDGGFHYLIGNGHGSVEVQTHTGHSYYITWLSPYGEVGVVLAQNAPADASLGFAKIQNKAGQVVKNPARYRPGNPLLHSLEADREQYKNRPEMTCEVPVAVIDPRKRGYQMFGVSVWRMEQFWKGLLQLPPGHPARRYAMLSTRQNCNGVVVDALLEGGLGWYAPPPGNLVYQDGRTLIQWVEKAARRITEMNEQHKEIRMQLAADKFENPGIQPDRTVPTYQEWKKESERGIAFYGSRKEQIAFIDDHLEGYHRAVQKQDKVAQFRRLFHILWYACSHLKHKPKSDRRAAVLWLARRVQGALEGLFVEHDRGPVATDLNRVPDVEREQTGLLDLQE